ncbi:hypothetical protein ABT127_30475 [Streptomyces sp. NPDC001904]|uniref:hypothetical protein n=1 Tax=Streptomyces sp. NPDC001904 TaxID=3154531 RepID=UPI00331A651C
MRGNLELVLCDEQDGLWVHWFNSDPQGTAPEPGGPPPGEWSGGLRFATGRRYDEVGVVQSRHGPHHLELVARSGDASHRLRWSPEAAFTTEPPPPSGPARGVVAAETTNGVLWTGVLGTSGEPRVLRADTSDYPHLTWSDDTPAHALLHDSRWTAMALVAVRDGARPGIVLAGHREGLYLSPTGETHPIPAGTVAAAVADDDGARVYVGAEGPWLEVVTPGRAGGARRLPLPGAGDVTALAATPVSFEPGRTDLVVRRGGQLWHLRDTGPGGATATATALMCRLTPAPDHGPHAVHRG